MLLRRGDPRSVDQLRIALELTYHQLSAADMRLRTTERQIDGDQQIDDVRVEAGSVVAERCS